MEWTGGGNCSGRSSKARRYGLSGALLVCATLSIGLRPSGLPAQQILPWCDVRQSAFVDGAEIKISGGTGILVDSSAGDVIRRCEQAEAELAEGRLREDSRREECVDFYYRGALHAWRALEVGSKLPATEVDCRAAYRTYQKCLDHLLFAASRFGQLDPRSHLVVGGPDGQREIRIAYYGFAWKPRDFCQVVAASEFENGELQRRYGTDGLGIPLVVLRRASGEEPFYPAAIPFAATAVLRPVHCVTPLSGSHRAMGTDDLEAVLEFYNPHLFESLPLGSVAARLARDLSAPFAYMVQEAPRQYFQGFLAPAETEVQPKLFMIEPYQTGKIPVVFIHGLLSDPITWVDAVNELRAQPDLYERYQFWYYRYPTGGVVLESAGKLREQLVAVRERFDPACEDAAMARMVFIGHSMGGLIARLQVTYSYDILWRHVARQPLEAVRATPAMRERLERDLFFDPSPLASRIVFIGTPHRGAGMAQRSVGRFASSLVRPLGTEDPLYRQLMDQNRDIFYEFLWESPPTSIDLLEPENPLLRALAQMPVRRGVQFHSIIGTGGRLLIGEPGDGVVSVSSARYPGACSELFVPARHTVLHKDPATVAELGRIMREHARCD